MKTKLLSIAAIFCSVQMHAAISSIRWGSSSDPLSGLTITWNNSVANDSIKWGYDSGFSQGTFAAQQRAGNGGGYFLKYVFPPVNASSLIYYKLFDSGTNSWSAQKTYKTAPPANTSAFSFFAMGDSRSGMTTWSQVSTLANSKGADFTLFNGDIVYSGSSLSDWSSWFSNGQQFIGNNLMYHSMGNHDANSVPYYKNTFDLPQTSGSNLYYSFNYGDAVFICLNSESASSTTQYNWLVSTLQANQNKKWKVVFFHRPFYTIGNHAGEMNSYYNTWWKAFDDYGVDLILNGHDHMYERTKPINRNVSTSSPVAAYGSGPQEGRCEIVCGGAGAPLYSSSSSWFIQSYQSTYHFCKFIVNDCKITCTVYSNTGSVIETFDLNKCTTTASCGTPSTLSASSITTTSATLNWGAVSGATSYNVQYKPTSSASWMNAASATTSVSVSGLSSSTQYEFQVQAVCSVTGSFSASSVFTTTSVSGTTVQFGTGTTTGLVGHPYGTSYMDERVQYILTQSELAAGGYTASNPLIQSLAFYATSSSGQAMNGFTIKMGHTAVTSFSSTSFLNAGMTTVYSGNPLVTANTWNTYNFSTAFQYNGTDNLLIEICWNNSSYTTNSSVQYNTSSAYRTLYYRYNSANGGVCTKSTGNRSYYRPNMKLVCSSAVAKESPAKAVYRIAGEAFFETDAPSFTGVNIYPNPTTGEITLSITTSESKEITLSFVDLLGRMYILRKYSVSEGTNLINLDVSVFDNGIYAIVIHDGEKVEKIRVVVER